MNHLEKYLNFIKEMEQLKSVLRTAFTSSGRQESTAEHTWRLTLFAALMADEFPEVDLGRLLLMSLIHDIGELYDGDISAALCPDEEEKYQTEYRAASKVFTLLPESKASELMELWQEYNDNSSPEAHLIKALDKAETIIQHNQGDNPDNFDYEFNLQYGSKYFQADPLLIELRAILDQETKTHLTPACPISENTP